MKTTTTCSWNKGLINPFHNERNEELIRQENDKKFHVDLDNKFGKSYHENLMKTDLKDAYNQIFGDSIEEYNSRQKRKDRRISVDDYMHQIENDNRGKTQTKRGNDGKRIVDEKAVRKGKQLSYEIHCCVGNTETATDENGYRMYTADGQEIRHEELSREKQAKILKQYASEFQKRNPNLVLINANLHADEGYFNKNGKWEYSNVGLHLEVIPVATGFKQGLSIQNSMNKALKSMGFESPDCYSEWAKNEQKRLEEITKQYEPDVEFYHPVSDKLREGDKTKEQHELEQQAKDALDRANKAVEQAKALAGIIESQARKKAEKAEKDFQEKEDALDAQNRVKLQELEELLKEALFNDEEHDMKTYMQSIVIRKNSRGMDITAFQDYQVKKMNKIENIRKRAEALCSNIEKSNDNNDNNDFTL